jgi:hypothetical protein
VQKSVTLDKANDDGTTKK